MTSERLTRASVGRQANIGDLYDIRTDCFCGRNAFDKVASLPLIVTNKDLKHTEFSIADSLHEKLTKLGIESELQLSLVANLAQAHDYAAAAVWHEKKAGRQSLAAYVSYRLVAVIKEMDLSAKEHVARMVSTEAFRDCNATHIVAAVSYGKEVIVHLEHAHDRSYNRKEIQQQLADSLACITRVIENDARDLMTDDCKLYLADICSNSAPPVNGEMMAVGDVLRYLRSFDSESETDDLDRKPLEFTLIPVNYLRDGLDHESGTSIGSGWTAVDDATVEKVVRTFENLTDASRQVKCLVRDFIEHDQYVSQADVNRALAFDRNLQEAVDTFQKNLARITVDVRAGSKKVSKIDRLLQKTEESEISISDVQQFIMSYDSVVDKIAFLNAITKEGVLYLANANVDLDTIVGNGEAIAFFASDETNLRNQRVWNENCKVFFDIMKDMKEQSLNATFVYVSCDDAPELAIEEGIAIRHYKDGTCVCRDVAERFAYLSSLSVAESVAAKQPITAMPSRRVLVDLKCPGSLSQCDPAERPWHCKECLEQLQYGFDDNFYCSCGRRLANTFKFKCNNPAHGRDFLEYPQSVMKQYLNKLQPLRELNILLLGETGVGKSTWINGFANYLTYPTLEEAELGETVSLIPSAFTMTNEEYEETLITTGVDKNEDHQPGRSATQFPKSYVFRHAKIEVRIIDTPGIGDTRGIDQDKINLQNIMNHLANLDYINGIIVLLKPNNSRLNVMFSFCIKELLTHLHRDACKNIVFCFTNARGTFYRPGDTLPALRTLLVDNQEIGMELNKETIYCFDNEAVRFLAAVKQGVKFDDTEKKNYATSWETSVAETIRLFERIAKLEPHKVKNTLSLNEARRLIVELTRPLAEISSTILKNIHVVEQREHEVGESMELKEQLVKTLYIPAIDLETTPLNYPRTVCTSPSCVKHIQIGGVSKVDYVKHCHRHCHITGTPSNTVNCTQLMECDAMQGRQTCRICGCSWKVHMHITYECRQVLTQVVDSNVEMQIQAKADTIETIKQHLQTLRSRVEELEDEKKKVSEVCAKFACFLKHNAIAAYNDSLADYLEHLIKIEKERVSAGSDRTALEGLENMRSMYEEEVRILDSAIKEPTSAVKMPTPDAIKCLAQTLYQLKISGPMLQKAMSVAEESSGRAAHYSEKRFDPRSSQRRGRGAVRISQNQQPMRPITVLWKRFTALWHY